MSCSCEFSGWFQQFLGSFGTSAPMAILFVLLVFFGNRATRREHFERMPIKRALLYNLPAVFMLTSAGMILLVLIWRTLKEGV